MRNPFYNIVPRYKESMVGGKATMSRLENELKTVKEKGKILILVGEHGSGRSLIVQNFKDVLRRKRMKIYEKDFSLRLLEEIRAHGTAKKRKSIFCIIDKFDYYCGLDLPILKKIIKLMIEVNDLGVNFLLVMTPDTLDELSKLNGSFKARTRITNIPPLNFEQAKKMILNRLNEVRRKKNNSLEPFTEEEMRHIWKKARGNPRMILLICASLFDAKSLMKEAV
jgi:type II secretory pathway predicted ATPase ExeA